MEILQFSCGQTAFGVVPPVQCTCGIVHIAATIVATGEKIGWQGLDTKPNFVV